MALNLGALLGEGGFCRVFAGQLASEPVAVKVLRPRADFEGEEEYEAARRSLAREAECLRLLAGHAAVPRLLRYLLDEGGPQLCLEQFAECLADMSSFEVDLLAMGAAVVAGLEHIHGHGLVHRDIHPGNIMRRACGSWGIIDYGLAAPFGTRQRAGTLLFQSVANMASRPTSGKDDLESFAYVLWDVSSPSGLPWRREASQTLGAVRRSKLSTKPPVELRALILHCRELDTVVDYAEARSALRLLCPPPTPSSAQDQEEEESGGAMEQVEESWLGSLGFRLALAGTAALASLTLGGLGGLALAGPLAMKVAAAVGSLASVKVSSVPIAPALLLLDTAFQQEGADGK